MTFLTEYAEKASEKLSNFKDFQGQPLDTQWCVPGGLYLQYLHSYNPEDGTIQLDNFSKFFTSVPPSPLPFASLYFPSLHSTRTHLLMYLANNSLYTVVFVRSPEAWLIPLTKLLIQQCIAIAHDTFIQLKRRRAYDSTFPFETPAKLLQRLLNSIMSDRTGTKTSIAYFIGNQLFRCYFKVESHCSLSFPPPSLSPRVVCVALL